MTVQRSRVFVVTGDGLVAVTLDGRDVIKRESSLDGLGSRCVAVDPRDRSRIVVGTVEDGIYASTDGGVTWRRDESGLTDRRVMAVAISPSDRRNGISVIYAGTEPSNLYRSADGGRSWRSLPALRDLPSEPRWSFPPRPWTHHVRTIALHPTDPDWLAVGIELGGVMRSRDAGASWGDHNPQAHSDVHALLIHRRAPDRLYEVAGQGVARSGDLGETWTRVENGLDRHYAWVQALDPADPELWYVAVSRSPRTAHGDDDGEARLFRSRGERWVAIDTWGDSPAMRRMPYALSPLREQPGSLLVGLRGGTLLLTLDSGESWSQLAVELTDVIDLVTTRD